MLLADLIGKKGLTGTAKEHEADFAGSEFFVAGKTFEHGLGGDAWGEHRRELIVLQQRKDLSRGCGVKPSMPFAEEERRSEAQ